MYLKQLNEEHPNNEDILSELYIVKKGLDGENEIAYQLKKYNKGFKPKAKKIAV